MDESTIDTSSNQADVVIEQRPIEDDPSTDAELAAMKLNAIEQRRCVWLVPLDGGYKVLRGNGARLP